MHEHSTGGARSDTVRDEVSATVEHERLNPAASFGLFLDSLLRADRQVRYLRIAQVMSAAQQAGLTRIGFITDPRTPR